MITHLIFIWVAVKRFYYRSGFKTSDQIQGQGVPQIGNGAYTSVREYSNPRDNTAIGPLEPLN
jgi:hypothetical protein